MSAPLDLPPFPAGSVPSQRGSEAGFRVRSSGLRRSMCSPSLQAGNSALEVLVSLRDFRDGESIEIMRDRRECLALSLGLARGMISY